MTQPLYVDVDGPKVSQSEMFFQDVTGKPVPVSPSNPVPVAAGAGGALATPSYTRIEDGTSSNLAAVLAFHNADRQSIPANGYGLLTGGVAQLLNAGGTLDRARGSGVDGVPAVGLPAGSTQNAMAFSTTAGPATVASAATVFTPAVMSGTVRGVAWSIQPGSTLIVDSGANLEVLVVASTTATTFTAASAKAHAAGVALSGFVYNQQKDATLADGSTPAGVNASATYFWNQALNGGTGGLEIERSAAGELSGASGAGTAVAAEYEYNGGGPVLANGLSSGLAFDRAMSVQAKGRYSAAVTATTAGASSLTFASAAATNLIQPGSPVFLTGGATAEVAYTTAGWVPGSAAVVPLINPLVQAGNTLAAVSTYGPNGPGLNGFTPEGVGIEEEALFDPVSGLFYLERAATQDAMPPQNVVAEAGTLWNGTGFDRARSLQAVAGTNAIGRESAHPGLPVFTSLNAVAAVASGTVLDCVVAHYIVSCVINLQATTAPTTFTAQLQGSHDNVNWFVVGAQATGTANGLQLILSNNAPARYFRAAVTALTGGTGVSVTATLAVAG